ncbi:MAG: hypothetical protein AMXMBFR82_01870 [Candidatus Hydrogenedentota bacterium]
MVQLADGPHLAEVVVELDTEAFADFLIERTEIFAIHDPNASRVSNYQRHPEDTYSIMKRAHWGVKGGEWDS